MTEHNNYTCPIAAAIHIIGGKYKIVILYHLTKGILRFNELQKLIPNATPKMLTQQLRELEASDLIARKVYAVVPPKTEYSLTDFGKTLLPVLEVLHQWGKTYILKENT